MAVSPKPQLLLPLHVTSMLLLVKEQEENDHPIAETDDTAVARIVKGRKSDDVDFMVMLQIYVRRRRGFCMMSMLGM